MQVLASWDDGAKDDLRMADLMAKYQIPTIFYWPSMMEKAKGRAKSHLSVDECKQIAQSFEIGSHSMSHSEMSRLSIPQLGNEISGSRKHWQDLLGQEIKSFAYPKNSITSLVQVLVKGAGYTSARNCVTGFLTKGDPFKITCTVQIGVDRVDYKGICWEQFADKMIAKADADSVFHIFGNSWEIEAQDDWQNLEDLLKKLS